jgi:hypothetical protein
MRRKWLPFAFAASLGALALFACVGDDPAATGGPTADGGSDTSTSTDSDPSGGDSAEREVPPGTRVR